MGPAEVWPPAPQRDPPAPERVIPLGNWRYYLGLGLAALDWTIAVCWPQAYRSWSLYRRLGPWEEAMAIYLMAASPVGFVVSLLGMRGPGRWAVGLSWLGAVLNVFPFFVFGIGCKGLDPTGF